MDIEQLRIYCLSKPDAEESIPFGPDVLVFKVNGKIFMLMPLDTDHLQINVKCNPDLAIEMRAEYACVQPGYHMNKKHWNTIIVDGSMPNSLLLEQIDNSYNLVVKKQSRGRK